MKLNNLLPFLIFLILIHSFLILLLSMNSSSVEFYGFTWHYSNTPIGIIHSYFTQNEELIFNREYLFEVSAQNFNSTYELIISIILLISSVISMIILYNIKSIRGILK